MPPSCRPLRDHCFRIEDGPACKPHPIGGGLPEPGLRRILGAHPSSVGRALHQRCLAGSGDGERPPPLHWALILYLTTRGPERGWKGTSVSQRGGGAASAGGLGKTGWGWGTGLTPARSPGLSALPLSRPSQEREAAKLPGLEPQPRNPVLEHCLNTQAGYF